MSTVHGINTPDLGEYYAENGFSSFHVSGAHFVMGDGSVRYLNETIDLWTLS
jgi:hypothetical protein